MAFSSARLSSKETLQSKHVSFSPELRIFYFERQQGNQAVPRQGGCTLGMSLLHFKKERVTVDEWQERSGVKRHYPINRSSGSSPEEELKVLDVESRWRLLEEAGVETINKEEGIECNEIRISRQDCGCDCESCYRETCSCALNGMICHSEDETLCFPCSCSKDSCKNPEGRTEFDGETICNTRKVIIQQENEKLE